MNRYEIPDRSRASLAPYLPIPYGTLKLLGVVVFTLTALVATQVFRSFNLFGVGVLVSLLCGFVAGLIMRIARSDVDDTTRWLLAYWDRNVRGYRLWVYKVGEEYRYRILREGVLDPRDPSVGFDDRAPVMLSVPLSERRPRQIDVRMVEAAVGPFTVFLKNREFDHARGSWEVSVQDFSGNRLIMSIEAALEVLLASTQMSTQLPHFSRQLSLNGVFMALGEEWRAQRRMSDRKGHELVSARIALSNAIDMIRSSTRFQRSKEGKEVREFLELRLRMLETGESEEDARAALAKST